MRTARKDVCSSNSERSSSSVDAATELGIAIVSTFHVQKADVRGAREKCDRGAWP